MQARLVSCTSSDNPVFLISLGGPRYYYGVPVAGTLEAETIIAPAPALSAMEALRRLSARVEPETITVYVSPGSPIASVASALGFRVEEVLGEETRLPGGLVLVSGQCGVYAEAGRTVFAPPCSIERIYAEAGRMRDLWAAERLVVAPQGAGIDAYLHRMALVYDVEIAVPECALPQARGLVDITVVRVGEELALAGAKEPTGGP